MKKTRELEDYARYLFQKELSERTIQIYTNQAALLLDFLQDSPVTKEGMIAYKRRLCEQGYKATTVNLYIVAANSYLKYAGHEECVIRAKRLQKNRSLENVISMEEYRRMASYAKESGRIKYYYIIKSLVFTGIRISELAFLTVESLGQGRFTVGNKGRTREVYVPARLAEELSEFCRAEQIQTGVIFKGNGQSPISRIAVYQMLLRLADMTGVEKQKAHPHSFRHLFALTYMKKYGDLTELADILGHSSLETTRIYTTTTAEEKRRKLDGLEF